MVERRTLRIALLVGIVLGAVAIPALAALMNGVPTSGTVPLESNQGATVYVSGAGNMSLQTPFPDAHTIEVVTDKGNMTVTSSGGGNLSVAAGDITGTWTTVTDINASGGANIKLDPEDKRAINVSGAITYIKFRDAALDDGTADFTYRGPDGTDSIVTVRGLAANTTVSAIDTQTGDTLGIATTDANGVATFELANSEHTVELESGGDDPPQLSDPRPDTNVSTAPDNFSVQVDHDDFPGDEVNLTWYHEGSQFATTTGINSSGRYNVSAPTLNDGLNDWSVVAEDEQGNIDIVNATVGLPGTLYIRNETNASELVDSPVTVTVAFKNGTNVTTVETTDGTIDMTGLPTTDFIVTVEASENYYKRVVYFQSIIGARSVYMLNTSYSAVETRFELDDPTGQFPANSLIIIKKAINKSGTNKYRTMYSDKFGVEGVTADLEQDQRYLISVRSPSGVVQQIGPYRSDTSETVTVRPGNPTLGLGEMQEGWGSAAALSNTTLEWRYADPTNSTQSVTIWIHEKNNKSNQLRKNVTYYDLGNVSGTYTLTQNESQKVWKVNFVIEFDDGQSVIASTTVQKGVSLVPNLSREWRLITGIGMLLISAGVFSILNAGVGGVVVALEGGVLWWSGWLDGATIGAAVVLALFVAVIMHIYTSQGPG